MQRLVSVIDYVQRMLDTVALQRQLYDDDVAAIVFHQKNVGRFHFDSAAFNVK